MKTIKLPTDEIFTQAYQEIATTPTYKSMTAYIQHAKISVYEHSLMVAATAFRWAKALGYKDLASVARGAMLHDYFLYDWHDRNKGFRGHGFKHPVFALNNASRDFNLNKKEKDIIKKHMFPFTFYMLPLYPASWLVGMADKYIATLEVFRAVKLEEEAILSKQSIDGN